ncbi:MAG: hypothetical protein QM537_02090 [Candidatus Symbiobacter sp.]|nr:hypothetical protein [Candidatus Symbiobacter sp.]
MHFEILCEDSSGLLFIRGILDKIIGKAGSPHTWNARKCKGLGRYKQKDGSLSDSELAVEMANNEGKLLNELPRLLRAIDNTSNIDFVVVIVDLDDRNLDSFKLDLMSIADKSGGKHLCEFFFCIEETEAWYIGDSIALELAYPECKKPVLEEYIQDDVCGTWELLADAIHPGGRAVLDNYRKAGDAKHEWAKKIAPHFEPDRNISPSFIVFRDGLRKLAQKSP